MINLSKLQLLFDNKKINSSSEINLKRLKEGKIINKKFTKLKILGSGELKTKIDISTNYITKQAQSKIEKIGCKLNILKK